MMKSLLALSALSGSVGAPPIVTFQSSVNLATSSASLAVDWLSYSNDKIEEGLPEDYSERYRTFRKDARKYWHKHVEPILSTVQEKYAAYSPQLIKTIGMMYYQVETLVNGVVDPIVQEFEMRHPSQAGMIGASLADRVTLLVWIYFLFKMIKRLLFGRSQGKI